MRSLAILVFTSIVACGSTSGHDGRDSPHVLRPISASMVSGGTLLVTKDHAFAANPDASVVDVVDLATRTIAWRAELPVGSEPGRMVEDDLGFVYAALRGAGGIATLDLHARTVSTRDACPSPRGLAVTRDDVIVVCEGGELVFLSRHNRSSRTVTLPRDLRDVIVLDDGSLFVTHFRSAEVSIVDRWGAPLGTVRPPPVTLTVTDPGSQIKRTEVMEPHVAWRAIRGPDDAVYVLHQYETTRALAAKAPNLVNLPYGGFVPASTTECDLRPVTTAITRFAEGRSSTVLVGFAGPALDLAIAGDTIAIAGGGGYGASIARLSRTSFAEWPTCVATENVYLAVPIVAVGWTKEDLIAQTRDQANLARYDFDGKDWSIALTPTTRDAGRSLFFASTRAGLACASCHPDGSDDGHVWRFQATRSTTPLQRRTPSLRGGLMATAPFHWEGDLPTIDALLDDVFTSRMGGPKVDGADASALARWLDRLPALAPRSTLDRVAVERGASRFVESGCMTCHSGTHFTNNATRDVGRGPLQVPSLRGVGARAPYMHDGCAATLMDRLRDPRCAGAQHGDTSRLTSADFLDLEAYLESL